MNSAAPGSVVTLIITQTQPHTQKYTLLAAEKHVGLKTVLFTAAWLVCQLAEHRRALEGNGGAT